MKLIVLCYSISLLINKVFQNKIALKQVKQYLKSVRIDIFILSELCHTTSI